MSPRNSLDDKEKRQLLNIPRLELRDIGRSVGSQSLYRLLYSGSLLFCRKKYLKKLFTLL
jgi:hypothetical protein